AVSTVFHNQETWHGPGPVRDAPAGRRSWRHGNVRVQRWRGHDIPRLSAPDRAHEHGPVFGFRSTASGEGAMQRLNSIRKPKTENRKPITDAAILVVDDELLIRETLVEYLCQEGFTVVSCSTGEEALEQANERRFDIVLCDVHLPGLDGLELLDRLQQI